MNPWMVNSPVIMLNKTQATDSSSIKFATNKVLDWVFGDLY